MTPDEPAAVSLYQQQDQAQLSPDSTFRFRCHAGLACFNRCCRTPTILLSPYDILRLKQCLGITSGEFLERYTLREIDQWSHLPLVFLNVFDSKGEGCPFLGEDGCRVYEHRPAACRLFPITMGSQLTEQGMVDYYFRRRLDYCEGFDSEMEWTVESWQSNQGFPEYARGRQPWLEILLKRGLQGPEGVDARLQDLFSTIAYDLDALRTLAEQPSFPASHGLAPPESHLVSDADLLKYSYRCLQALPAPESS